MKIEIALAQRALELAMLISTETTTHAWFEYSGHINSVDAEYAPNGYQSNHKEPPELESNTVYIANMAKPTVETLRYIVDCFEFLYAVAERNNV